MKTLTSLLPLAMLVVDCQAKAPVIVDKLTPDPYNVTWKQTQSKPNTQLSGALGSSISGHFPLMSDAQIGMGCGIDWRDGQLHAGFDGGDLSNGVGGGFTWTQNALSSIVGVHFKESKINLNLTITGKEVIFNVNGKDLDWQKVLKQIKPHNQEVKVSIDNDDDDDVPLGTSASPSLP